MTTWPILSVVTFLPAIGALLVYVAARGNDEAANRNARWIALGSARETLSYPGERALIERLLSKMPSGR